MFYFGVIFMKVEGEKGRGGRGLLIYQDILSLAHSCCTPSGCCLLDGLEKNRTM